MLIVDSHKLRSLQDYKLVEFREFRAENYNLLPSLENHSHVQLRM